MNIPDMAEKRLKSAITPRIIPRCLKGELTIFDDVMAAIPPETKVNTAKMP
jgi:hypothetical protein